MTSLTCFGKSGAFATVLRRKICRVGIIPAMKFNANLTNIHLNKTYLERHRGLPIYNPVKTLSTSMVRLSDETPHDHAKLWIVEKSTTVLLLILIPSGLAYPNKIIDFTLSVLISAHAFWGMEALVVEYVRVLLFGHALPKLATLVVYGLTATMFGGLCYLNFNDIGMCKAFWRIWTNMAKPTEEPPTAPGVKGGAKNKCPK